MRAPLRLAECLDRLEAGLLRVRPPLPPHLVTEAAAVVSHDWFTTAAEVPLEPEGADGPLAADLPVAPGETIQYRFRARHRFEPRELFLDRGGGNHVFTRPHAWVRHPLDPADGRLFDLLEAGRAVAVPAGELPGAGEPLVLFNLLGGSAYADATTRTGERATPFALVRPSRAAAFFAGEAITRVPTGFFLERITDPAFPARERIRVLEPPEGTPLDGALARLDTAHWFPVCGALPWRAPGAGIRDAAALLAAFFGSHLDALVADGWVVTREAGGHQG